MQKIMSYSTFTLPNGLRVIHAPSPTNVAYCGYAVDAGTRDEQPHEQGMAHFVEHLIFKGTHKRKAWHILNRMENVGGDLNAYTNKEETVVYSAFLKEHFSRAAELLTDIVFHSTYPQQEIDKEVEVIIDEIQSYEDSPAELIFDDFEELIFPNHPLGRNILGKPDLLRNFTSQDALNFTRRYYRSTNMVFFILGDIDFRKVLRTLEKVTADIPSSAVEGYHRQSPLPYRPQHLTTHKDTHQAHVMIGARAYSARDPRHLSLYLLNNILGGPGMNSRLNLSLREKHGLVYTVESVMTTYTDTGLWSVYFGCDPHDVTRCRRLVLKELRRLAEAPLAPHALEAAKRQIKGQIGISYDNFENVALAMGKTFLHYDRARDLNRLYQKIDGLTAEDLHAVAQELFRPENLTFLIYR